MDRKARIRAILTPAFDEAERIANRSRRRTTILVSGLVAGLTMGIGGMAGGLYVGIKTGLTYANANQADPIHQDAKMVTPNDIPDVAARRAAYALDLSKRLEPCTPTAERPGRGITEFCTGKYF